jgi:hypothetical protein
VEANVWKFSYFFNCLFNFHCIFNYTKGPISVVNFSEISWSVADREFDRLSGQIKVYEDGICCSEAVRYKSS